MTPIPKESDRDLSTTPNKWVKSHLTMLIWIIDNPESPSRTVQHDLVCALGAFLSSYSFVSGVWALGYACWHPS
jgi:hypothetical protein